MKTIFYRAMQMRMMTKMMISSITNFYNPPRHMHATNIKGFDEDPEFVHFLDYKGMDLHAIGNMYIRMKFRYKEISLHAIKEFHISNFVDFKVSKYDHYIFVAKCTHDSCNRRCRASSVKKKNLWKIKRLEGSHTCVATMLSQDHQNLDLAMICNSIMSLKIRLIHHSVCAHYAHQEHNKVHNHL
ncbi:hypothetical protein CR513_12182, partial [Mucuna pruriens]